MEATSSSLRSTHRKEISYFVILTAGLGLLFFVAPHLTSNNVPLCFIKTLTGHPCPGCGLTRGSVAFWDFDLATAWHFHLLAIPLNIFLVVVWFWLLKDLLQKKHSFVRFFERPYPWYVYVLAAGILLVNWIRAFHNGL